MYGPAARCKRFSSSWRLAVLHQCIRPLIGAYAPGHHGYQRACVLISGQASTGHSGHQCSHAPGIPNLHLVVAHDVERVLADIDADHGDRGCLGHGVLLVFGAPCPASLAGGAGARPDHPISVHCRAEESSALRDLTHPQAGKCLSHNRNMNSTESVLQHVASQGCGPLSLPRCSARHSVQTAISSHRNNSREQWRSFTHFLHCPRLLSF
jgi:hypothetical protein